MALNDSSRDPGLPPVHESVRRNRRWGCACGCAFFLLLLLFGILGATWWLIRPQAAGSRDLLLPNQAIAFGVVRFQGDDAGIKEMTQFVYNLAEQSATGNTNRTGLDVQASKFVLKTLRSFLTKLVQGDGAIALVESPRGATTSNPTGLDVLFGFHTRNHMGTLMGQSLLRQVNGNNAQPVVQNNGVFMNSTGPGSHIPVGWRGNLMLFSTSVDLVTASLERVDLSQSVAADGELQDLLDQIQFSSPPSDQDMAFAMVLKPGLLQRVVRQVGSAGREPTMEPQLSQALTAAGLDWNDALGLTVTGDVINADSIKTEIRIVMARPEVARKLLSTLTSAYAQPPGTESSPTRPDQISVRRDMKVTGSVVSMTITLTNLRAWLRKSLGVPAPGAVAPAGAGTAATQATPRSNP